MFVVIVRTTAGMGRVTPEFSFSFLVPKATSCRNVDLEIKRMNSLTLSMFRRHRNNFSGTFVSPAPISLTCCLAFYICRLEMSGISSCSSVWLYFSHISESI